MRLQQHFKSIIVGIFALITLSCSVPVQTHCCKTENPEFASSSYPVSSFIRLEVFLGVNQVGMGSGAVIAQTPEASYALTADHLCEVEPAKRAQRQTGLTLRHVAFDLDGKPFFAEPYLQDSWHDLCIVKIPLMQRPPLALSSQAPRIGDTYLNMANPLGMAQPGFVPLFQGVFSGTAQLPGKPQSHIYTIPTKRGSSGSPILDQDYRIVGVLVIGFEGMESVGASPEYDVVIHFVRDGLTKILEEEPIQSLP